MDLGPNYSYNVRVTKRKSNKLRFLFYMFIVVVLVFGVVFIFNSGVRKSVTGLFSGTSESKESTKKEATGSKNAATTDQEGISTQSGTAQEQTPEVTAPPKDFTLLKSDLETYIKTFQGQYGVYFIDLESGHEFGINDTDTYFAASTVKVPINLYLYKKIEAGTINLDQTMTYNYSMDYEGGTGALQASKNGRKLTIRELSKLSITVSDNIAINMLIRLVGRKNYKEFMRQQGGQVVTEKNVSCPKDMGIYMKQVYEFQKTNPELGDQLIGYLQNTVFNDRIPKLLPPEIKVAHKIGNYSGGTWGNVINDVGIVYTERPYIISVMSKNASQTEGNDVIANISKKVYDFMIKGAVAKQK